MGCCVSHEPARRRRNRIQRRVRRQKLHHQMKPLWTWIIGWQRALVGLDHENIFTPDVHTSVHHLSNHELKQMYKHDFEADTANRKQPYIHQWRFEHHRWDDEGQPIMDININDTDYRQWTQRQRSSRTVFPYARSQTRGILVENGWPVVIIDMIDGYVEDRNMKFFCWWMGNIYPKVEERNWRRVQHVEYEFDQQYGLAWDDRLSNSEPRRTRYDDVRRKQLKPGPFQPEPSPYFRSQHSRYNRCYRCPDEEAHEPFVVHAKRHMQFVEKDDVLHKQRMDHFFERWADKMRLFGLSRRDIERA